MELRNRRWRHAAFARRGNRTGGAEAGPFGPRGLERLYRGSTGA